MPRGPVSIPPDQVERFALALEAINESVYDWDLASNTFEHLALTDTTMKRWVDEPRTPAEWLDMIHWEDQPVYARAVRAHLAGHTTRLICEYRYRARDKSWRWARQQGIAVRGPDGIATRVVGAVGDITAQKERESELERARVDAAAAQAETARANELMATVLDNMTDGVLLLDKDFRWLMANRQLTDFQAFPQGFAHIGVSGYDILRFQAKRGDFGPVDDIEKAVAERAAIMQTPGGLTYSRWMDGHFIEFAFKPLADGRLLAVYRNLTALKASQEALQRTEQKLRDAVEVQPSGFAVLDADNKLAMFNSAYAAILPDVPAWTRIGITIPQAVQALAEAKAVPSLAYGNVDAHIGFWNAFLDDPSQPAEINFTNKVIQLAGRKTSDGSTVMLYTDITGQKDREIALQRAEERLRDAIEYQSGGFALYDADMRLITCNATFASLAPSVPEWRIPGTHIRTIMTAVASSGVVPDLTPDKTDRFIEFWSAYGDRPDRPVQLDLMDGRSLQIEARKTAEGNTVVVFNDLSVLKQRERELADAQELLRDAIDNQSGAFSVYDPQYRLITCNAGFAELVPHVEEWRTPGLSLETRLRAVALRGGFPGIGPDNADAYIAYWHQYFGNPDRPVELFLGGQHWVQLEGRRTPNGNIVVLINDLSQLKQREQELAQTQQRLTEAIENQAGGFALFDPDLVLISCNGAFAALAPSVPEWSTPGVSLETILQAVVDRGAYPGLDGDGGPAYIARWLAYMRAPDRSVQLRVSKDRWVQLEARKTPDGNTVVLFSDLSELKKRERELAQTQERLAEAIENQAGGFALYGPDYRLITCNAAFAALLPNVEEWRTPDLPLGDVLQAVAKKTNFPGMNGVTPEAYAEHWTRYMRNPDRPVQLHIGGNRWVQVEGRKTPNGNTVVLFNDLSKLKQRERELATAQERLTAAIENLVDGFAYFDADEKLVICNEAYRQFMQHAPKAVTPGYTIEEGLRDRFQQEPLPYFPIPAEQYLQRFLDVHRGGNANIEVPLAQGRFVRIRNQKSPDGGVVVVVADISELKNRAADLEKARDLAERERAEAEAANQSKSTFLATMSHEIRTPMNGVLGMMDVLEYQGLNDTQRRTVGTMRDSAQALLRIIDDVLDFSKIEAGRLELEETAFSLSGLIESVIATFKAQAQAKGLALFSEIRPDSHDALVGDPTRVRQVLFNLLGNALKFTARGSVRVEAGTTPLGDGRAGVTLTVTDTGIGLTDEERGRLFRPFAQADSSTTRRFGGSGLGLSIVRRLAQLMGGDVVVTSTPGAGATFEVTLALEAAPADSPLHTMLRRAPMTPVAVADVSGVKVLVVDDHPVNRDVLVMQLNLLGIPSDTADDGVQALDLWQPGRYAVVLADIHMPNMDGYEMTRQLRAREPQGLRTPVVAVTANALKGEEARCHDAGMDGYLAKPVSMDRLRATLERWLNVQSPASNRDAKAEPPKTAAIDRDVLIAWLGDDTEAIDGLLRKFRKTAVEAERDISAAFGAGDLAALAAAAHKLKGAAQTVGARRLGNAAGTLEQSGKAGDRIQCRDSLGTLASEMRGVLAELPAN